MISHHSLLYTLEPHPQPRRVAPPQRSEMATREELDHLFSPSKWSKRLPADVIVIQHEKIVREGNRLSCARTHAHTHTHTHAHTHTRTHAHTHTRTHAHTHTRTHAHTHTRTHAHTHTRTHAHTHTYTRTHAHAHTRTHTHTHTYTLV